MTTHKTTLKSPVRRADGLTERPLGTELLLHDIASDQVTALDPGAAAVWRLCDGSHSIEQIAAEAGQSPEEVAGRLATLDDAGLLTAVGMSRRTLLTRAGVVGLAVPVVSMLNLPAAAAAGSVLAQTTTFSCLLGNFVNSSGNFLILTTNVTGGTNAGVYSLFVYSNAVLTTLLGSDTNNTASAAGAVSFSVTTNTTHLIRGTTLYLKLTKGTNSTTTDTVFQVVIPANTPSGCTDAP